MGVWYGDPTFVGTMQPVGESYRCWFLLAGISRGSSSPLGSPDMLKVSGVGVHFPIKPAAEAAAFLQKRLLGCVTYRASPVPAEGWNIQACRGSCVMT